MRHPHDLHREEPDTVRAGGHLQMRRPHDQILPDPQQVKRRIWQKPTPTRIDPFRDDLQSLLV